MSSLYLQPHPSLMLATSVKISFRRGGSPDILLSDSKGSNNANDAAQRCKIPFQRAADDGSKDTPTGTMEGGRRLVGIAGPGATWRTAQEQ
ncbi:hypothetical protein CEK25_004163 [Fusarium fujikuroi]|nr:hypothetical protein CEK25_004163 [Fusarium fujikuroi]